MKMNKKAQDGGTSFSGSAVMKYLLLIALLVIIFVMILSAKNFLNQYLSGF